METILSNKAYDIGKYVAQVALPAVATFYAAVGALWGFPNVTEVVGTITATDTLLGALLLISGAQYNKAVEAKKAAAREANR
jgi:hypothetical protein